MGKILITGGAGFIGSHLVDHFLQIQQRVVVLDNLSTGRKANLDLTNPLLQFYNTDIRDTTYKLWDNIFSKHNIEFIFHLASIVGVNNVMANPLQTIETNIFASKPLINCACDNGIPFLFTSSSEVYGKNNGEFINETDDRILGNVNNKRWVYACTKTLEEFYLLAMYKAYNFPVIITRLFNTIGPRQVGDYGMVVPRFIERALNNEPIEIYGTGNQKRSFCDIRDTIKILVSLSKNQKSHGQIFNVGNDQEISINDLAELVISLTGSTAGMEYINYERAYGDGFEDMQSRRPNIFKIKEFFKHKTNKCIPLYELKDSIRYIIKNME